MWKAPGVLGTVLCVLAASVASAEVHHIDWTDALRVDVGRDGSSFDLDGGLATIDNELPIRIARIEIPPDARVTGVSILPISETDLPQRRARNAGHLLSRQRLTRRVR